MNIRLIIVLVTLVSFIISCKNKIKETVKPKVDISLIGTTKICAEKAFEPIINEQITIFQDIHPQAKIEVNYFNETEGFNKFLNDTSYKLMISSRYLYSNEVKFCIEKNNNAPREDLVAWDGVTLIANKTSSDTGFQFNQLQDLLTGKVKSNKIFIFDGLTTTANSRFIKDSILLGQNYDSTIVKGVENTADVINYVKANKNAIGFVSSMWVMNVRDNDQIKLKNELKILKMKCKSCDNENYFTPTQFSILSKDYPLRRGIYYAVNEYGVGLASQFGNFLKQEKGQLIFKLAGLGQAKIGFAVRKIQINNN